jgi:hypothetical protein
MSIDDLAKVPPDGKARQTKKSTFLGMLPKVPKKFSMRKAKSRAALVHDLSSIHSADF